MQGRKAIPCAGRGRALYKIRTWFGAADGADTERRGLCESRQERKAGKEQIHCDGAEDVLPGLAMHCARSGEGQRVGMAGHVTAPEGGEATNQEQASNFISGICQRKVSTKFARSRCMAGRVSDSVCAR